MTKASVESKGLAAVDVAICFFFCQKRLYTLSNNIKWSVKKWFIVTNLAICGSRFMRLKPLAYEGAVVVSILRNSFFTVYIRIYIYLSTYIW